jgi:hypothetical protein
MTWTGIPSKSVGIRFGQASPNRTPSIDIRISTRAGGRPNLVKGSLLGEVRLGEIRQRSPESLEGMEDGSGILRRRLNPEVEVLGVTRFGVLAHRIAADDQVTDPSGVENTQ